MTPGIQIIEEDFGGLSYTDSSWQISSCPDWFVLYSDNNCQGVLINKSDVWKFVTALALMFPTEFKQGVGAIE